MPVDPLERLRELRGDYRRAEAFISEWRCQMRRALADDSPEEVAEAAGLSVAEVEEISRLVAERETPASST
jgi:hypothetical protein